MAPTPLQGRPAIDFYTNIVWKAFPDQAVQLTDGPFLDPPTSPSNGSQGTHTGLLDPPGWGRDR